MTLTRQELAKIRDEFNTKLNEIRSQFDSVIESLRQEIDKKRIEQLRGKFNKI